MKIKALLFTLASFNFISSQAVNTPQTFFTGGGCATIPSVGSPILMIANAHKYIEDALNVKNQYTVVKYIHFVQIASSTTPGQNTYKMAFSITDYTSTKYVGIEAVLSPTGIGASRINKFIFTTDLPKLRTIIDSTINPANSFSCGDLKFAYSSTGNNDSSKLDYIFPGRNQNGARQSILDQLKNTDPRPKVKTCITANYLESTDFYGTTSSAPVPTDAISCVPNKRTVSAIRIGCLSNATVSNIEMVFNNFNDGGTNNVFVGNPTLSQNFIEYIDLSIAERIEFISHSLGSALKLTINTYNNIGEVESTYTCGSISGNNKRVIVMASDFLGFSKIFFATRIQKFEIVQYRES